MRTHVVGGALPLILASVLPAAYSNLIATAGGNTVYFQVKTSFGSQSWYAVRVSDSGIAVEAVNESLADVSGTGTLLASNTYYSRTCTLPGSTCFLAPLCSASFRIHGPAIDVSNAQRSTFVRLDRGGGLAWIAQKDPADCSAITAPSPSPALNGLYELSPLRRVAASNNAILANLRFGRRSITDRGQALIFVGAQLEWIDANGAHAIPHRPGALEAVTDATGSNVVYVEGQIGRLHWISGQDEDLGLIGSAPALTDDGRLLAFLTPAGVLQIYDRALRTVRPVVSEAYSSFTLGGNTLFAVTMDGRLVRIDLANNESSTLLQAFPEIESIDVPPFQFGTTCQRVCYGYEPWFALGQGMIVLLHGHHLDQTRWRVRFGSRDIPLNPLSDQEAWFQVPSDLELSSGYQPVSIYSSEFPALQFTVPASVVDRSVTCFAILHQDSSRPVSISDPATPGEIVTVYLTGLRGVEAIPDGTPNPIDHLIGIANPPAFIDPGATEPTFFGLAPGLVGIQQLNLRVLRPAVAPPGFSQPEPDLFFSSFGCTQPVLSP